jgi:hypothetical protein
MLTGVKLGNLRLESLHTLIFCLMVITPFWIEYLDFLMQGNDSRTCVQIIVAIAMFLKFLN